MAQPVKNPPAIRETWVQSLGWEDPLEKEMAIHSRTIAWKISWTEEPGRLQSMGSQRVGHDWVTSLHLYIKTKYVGGKTKVKNDSFVIYTISNSEEVWVTIGHWYSASWRVVIFVKYIWIKVGYGVDSSHDSQLMKFLFILPQVLYSSPTLVNPRSIFTTKNWWKPWKI